MITNNLPTWLDAGKIIHDPRLLWDWVKFNIRSNSIIFSKQIATIRLIICEGRITVEECQNVLKTFPTGKTPGNDVIPSKFYNTFWPLLSDTLINSFNETFMKKEMSPSQRQAVITLIEKQDKDRTYLENNYWRSISLTNIDAKIASKVIATRIVKVLPEIIHSNQTGYVSGRYIGEATRSILNIMDYTKTYDIPGLLLFIDFEKAFDSLEWNFMFKCLEVFGFGPSLTRWIETFYSNIHCNKLYFYQQWNTFS